ncbi:RNA-directed DNA polymerase, eukaryota, reverse transcriptase zinc-binding domain protein [Tanacetum coccineum]
MTSDLPRPTLYTTEFSAHYKLSNELLLERFLCNIFITNFPVHLSSKELWNSCAQYGTVQDVFIPNKLSKEGKLLAFAHFNKISDVDTLIRNLRSIWLENFRIYANVAWFTRESKPKSFSQNSAPKEPMHVNSKPKELVHESGSLNYEGDPVLVGCVKDFKTLPNIHNVCFSEGFNRGKNKLFSLKQWNAQFEIPDRVVWIDVEGTPLQAWSHVTFNMIASKWGELVYMDESNASNKYIMRLCVKTTVGIHKWEEENDDEVIPDSFQSIVNEYNIMENSPNHVENSPGQMHNSPNQMENFDVFEL